MAMDNASKMRAIRRAIEILQESSSKNKTMDVNEMNYAIDTLKDKEKQLQLEIDEPTGTAWWQDVSYILNGVLLHYQAAVSITKRTDSNISIFAKQHIHHSKLNWQKAPCNGTIRMTFVIIIVYREQL